MGRKLCRLALPRPALYQLIVSSTWCSTQRPRDSVAGGAGHDQELQEKELR